MMTEANTETMNVASLHPWPRRMYRILRRTPGTPQYYAEKDRKRRQRNQRCRQSQNIGLGGDEG